MVGPLDAKELITKIIFAFASVLVLGTSACEQSGADQVVTLDVKKALEPGEGTLHICTTGESFEVRVVQGRQTDGDTCVAYPVEYVHHEGSFPYADAVIEGTAYPANEVHLVHRSSGWFLFIEGNHDQSVMHEHKGVVFQVVRGTGAKGTELARKCSGHIEAWDEDDDILYQCIYEKLQSRGIGLVKWKGADSCLIDYSICR